MWNTILKKIDKVNKMLQVKEQTISSPANMIEVLKHEIKHFRDSETRIERIFAEAFVICGDLSVEPKFPEKRKRKVKKRPGEVAADERTTDDVQEFRIEMFEVIDKIFMQMDNRFQMLKKIIVTIQFF